MIKKLLIANRGEIAIRIMRTCKEMGIKTVAVYSTADSNALHVQLASEAVCIGGAKSSESYLDMNAIIQAACLTGCDAIHPGFGFLSENPKFARLVEECGLVFIGPSAEIIEKMGNKAEARKTMMNADVSVVPGSKDIVENIDDARKQASNIGYPIMIKASAGGGGRGMRIVKSEESFDKLFNQAQSEAIACFNNGDIYIEKFIEAPKHIEVQLLGDKHGNVVHLYERDCSFQRRNQKMVEEAPCYSLNDGIRQKLLDDAVKAAKYIGYDSVGTIEFLVDVHGNHYFMEMNTRIQVEHPITEMITGIDLIKHQIRVADGKELGFNQEDVSIKGYAMECRINAEDPKRDFAPNPGTIGFLNLPGGMGGRVENSVYSGYEITPYYDSMIMKLITYAPTRLECIKKMRGALEELIIDNVETNLEFHYLLLHQRKFLEGKYDTSYAEEFIEELKSSEQFI
ncbi:MAG: acetyl-CoA carboxylase biotin carboxylase subunit [Tissierellia bacterium]|nr:acetyl-CoA carboxylase biotin carboxylase subunit [Tissierellia bacterium]